LDVPGSPIGQQHSVILYDCIRADGVTVPSDLVTIVAGGLTRASGFVSHTVEVRWRQAIFGKRAGKGGCGGAEIRDGF